MCAGWWCCSCQRFALKKKKKKIKQTEFVIGPISTTSLQRLGTMCSNRCKTKKLWMYSSISETSVSVLACVTSSKGCFWLISRSPIRKRNKLIWISHCRKKKVVFVSFRGPTFTSHFVRYTMLLYWFGPLFAFRAVLILNSTDSTRLLEIFLRHFGPCYVTESRSCCRFVRCTLMMRICCSTTSQMTFVTWCFILMVAAIRRWLHCGHFRQQ